MVALERGGVRAGGSVATLQRLCHLIALLCSQAEVVESGDVRYKLLAQPQNGHRALSGNKYV